MASTHMRPLIIGVRYEGKTSLAFVRLPSALTPVEPGEWVLVEATEGRRNGLVTIGADQFLTSLQEEFVSGVVIARVVAAVTERTIRQEPSVEINAELTSIGGTGLVPDREHVESREDIRYRELKARAPSLGTSVVTPDGQGIVIRVDVFRHRVWVQTADRSDPSIYSIGDITKP